MTDDDKAKRLSTLIALFEAGALTADEFKVEKERLERGEVESSELVEDVDDEYTDEELVEQELHSLKNEEADGGWFGFIKFMLIGVLIIGAFFALSQCGSSGPSKDDGPKAVQDFELRDMCEQWVKNQLKAPSTAKFSDHAIKSTGANNWTVTGAVDADNSFGAAIRSTWSCEITLDGDTWRGGVTLN